MSRKAAAKSTVNHSSEYALRRAERCVAGACALMFCVAGATANAAAAAPPQDDEATRGLWD